MALGTQVGWHPKQIQEMVGHSSIQVTFDTDGHLFRSLHYEGADQLDALRAEVVAAQKEVTRISAARKAKTVG